MRYGLADEQFRAVIKTLAGSGKIATAILFGSRAMGTFKAASDIDIVLCGKHVDFALAVHIEAELEASDLPFFFDVIAWSTITSQNLKRHIWDCGQVIYKRGWQEIAASNGLRLRPSWWQMRGGETGWVGWEHVEQLSSGVYKLITASFDDSSCTGCCTDRLSNLANYQVDNDYYAYFMAHQYFVAGIDALSQGVLEVDWGCAAPSQWLMPPLAQQQSIVAILKNFDKLIELLQCQSQVLEQMAQLWCQQWLVVRAGDSWPQQPLAAIANYHHGLDCQDYPAQKDQEKLPVLSLNELKDGLSYQTVWIDATVDNKYIVKPGDVVFSCLQPGELKIWSGPKCVLDHHLIKIDSPDYPEWLCYFWIRYYLEKFRQSASDQRTAAGHSAQGVQDLLRQKALIPPGALLAEMDEYVGCIFKKIKLNHQKSLILTQIRDMLLPKLVSGQIDGL